MRIRKVKSPRTLVRVKRVDTEVSTKEQARGRKEKGTLEEEDYDRGVGPSPKRAESE